MLNIWKCSDCEVSIEIDNLLGYDIKVNGICDGHKIIKIEIKPYE